MAGVALVAAIVSFIITHSIAKSLAGAAEVGWAEGPGVILVVVVVVLWLPPSNAPTHRVQLFSCQSWVGAF